MSILENLEKFKIKNLHSDPDVNYINNPDFCMKINNALSELYRVKPKNPITYLANYLLNDSKSVEILHQIEEKNHIKIESLFKNSKEIKQKQEVEENKQRIINEVSNKRKALLDKIRTSEDIDAVLNNICDELKNLVQATGVYVSSFDKKRKFVSEKDDELAHLLEYDVIRYIAYDKEHSELLQHKCLEPNEGVTYDLFAPVDDVNNPSMDNTNTVTDGEKELKSIHEIEVIRNPKIKYFREPRLGSYLAIDISYQSSISLKSLDSSINKWMEYLQEQEEIAKRKAERDAQKKDDVDNNMDNNGDPQDPSLDKDKAEEEEEVAVLKPYDTEEKRTIFSLDTLGQDRSFTLSELEFIREVAKTIKISYYDLEKKLLLKDRDLKLHSREIEAKWLEENKEDKIKESEDKFYKEYLFQKYEDSPPNNDEIKQIDMAFSKAKYIVTQILEPENFFNQEILLFAKFEIVPFEKIFQNILYFVGYSNEVINENFTNKLEWKKARKHWNLSVFEKLKYYNPFGPKPQKVPYFCLVNRQLDIFEQLYKSIEDIKETNFAISRLVEFMHLILTLRRDDVFKRKKEQYEYNLNRTFLIEKKKERDRLLEEDLKEARREFEEKKLNMDGNNMSMDGNQDVSDVGGNNDGDNMGEDPEDDKTFKEEKFINEWLANKSLIEIPPEIQLDEDNDIEMNIEDFVHSDDQPVHM